MLCVISMLLDDWLSSPRQDKSDEPRPLVFALGTGFSGTVNEHPKWEGVSASV